MAPLGPLGFVSETIHSLSNVVYGKALERQKLK